jgi:hypothetical protein
MGKGNFLIITPERLADHLERLVDDPAELREQVEAQVLAQLRDAEVSARFGAVVLRRIRDKELYVPSGWPSWRDFCAYFSPQEPERIDILIKALEVLESRGEKRDFGEDEAKRLAGWGGDRRSQEAREDQAGPVQLERGEMNTAKHWRLRLAREATHNDEARALLEQVEARTITPNAAARAMGWRKKPTPYGDMVSGWRRASDHDRMRFEEFIEQWHREQVEVA